MGDRFTKRHHRIEFTISEGETRGRGFDEVHVVEVGTFCPGLVDQTGGDVDTDHTLAARREHLGENPCPAAEVQHLSCKG